MGKTYEALYENGHLEWLGEPPGAGRHRLLVTVVSTSPPRHTLQEVRRMLAATRGAWGHGKTLDDIDAEIARMRAEWDRVERKA
jgi:hypothetical protein